MANQYDYDEDDEDTTTAQEQQIPAGLRKALKRLEKENQELREANALRDSMLRERTVKDVLDSKGVPSKIAKFIPSDVSTPEQVNSWLTENADVFGFQTTQEPDAVDEKRQEAASQFQRINNATETAIPATNVADLTARINNPNLTKADLDAITGVNGYTGSGRRAF
jgi:hypothetical protein